MVTKNGIPPFQNDFVADLGVCCYSASHYGPQVFQVGTAVSKGLRIKMIATLLEVCIKRCVEGLESGRLAIGDHDEVHIMTKSDLYYLFSQMRSVGVDQKCTGSALSAWECDLLDLH